MRGLRILFVEDLPEDAELASHELRKAGLVFESTRVDSREGFLEALSSFEPTIVVSDYSMPSFDGMEALQLCLREKPGLPFIVLTGSKNEETAVLCLKSGATDYVIKGRMSRLPFAVREALNSARARREEEAASRALRESEQRYRTLADSGRALVWTSDEDRLCRYFNKPWLEFTGRSYEEEYGNGWAEGVHPEDLERCIAAYTAAFDAREKFSMEYRLRRHDGEYRWVQDDGCPRYGPSGEFLGYIGHCLDITERKLAEATLRRALAEKETLLRELYHRTRNNMQVIMAMLGIEKSLAKEKAVAEIVDRTSKRIMAMALVHKKLYESLDFSRVDLKAYTQELIQSLEREPSFPASRISVSIRAEPVSASIDTAVPFGLVLHELVSNAFRYAYPGEARGGVSVAVSRDQEGQIGLVVEDEGLGLPEGFDLKRKDTLGFQLVYGLVEQQLHGSVSFESRKGLRCVVRFTEPEVRGRN